MINILKKIANKDQRRGLSHSVIKSHRYISNCKPECPSFNIWKYLYKPPGSKKNIESKKPISTIKKHWKHKDEARIISINLFGKQDKYYEGFFQFLDSLELIKLINNIESWFLDTFTFRVYVARPSDKKIKTNSTPLKYIKEMLKRNVEIVYVDNNQKSFNLDGSFWRFLVADEKIDRKGRIRFLCRDADWKMTMIEAILISEWINSSYDYHRINIFPICAGPLLAGLVGGIISKKTPKLNIKKKLENYPYRYEYGDDELFLRDLVWPQLLSSNSILTHTTKKDYRYKIANPYKDSCFEPTKKYCKSYSITKKIKKPKMKLKECKDIIIPKNPPHYSIKYSSEVHLKTMFNNNPEFFTLSKNILSYNELLKQMNIKFYN